MKNSGIKVFLLTGVLALLMTACSSTPGGGNTGGGYSGTTVVSDNQVATGSVSGSGVSGSVIDVTGDVDTVFYFDFNKTILKPESLVALRIHAQRLVSSPANIKLQGHADERGTREYNIALGERRAMAVKEFLVLKGVNGGSIETISYGEERPAVQGSSDASWALNRRVEIR